MSEFEFFTVADCDHCSMGSYGQAPYRAITLEKANRLLQARGKVVKRTAEYPNSWFDQYHRRFSEDPQNNTHQALLIGIAPIEKDTAESLLEQIYKNWKSGSFFPDDETIERAKRLLEGK